MLKALFIIATILVAVVLATQPIEDSQKHQHSHHKRQHVGQSSGHLTKLSKPHHLLEASKEQINHGRVNVAIAPHNSRAHRNNKRHKSQKSSKASKSHHHDQQKSTHRKKQSHKMQRHGRKHH